LKGWRNDSEKKIDTGVKVNESDDCKNVNVSMGREADFFKRGLKK